MASNNAFTLNGSNPLAPTGFLNQSTKTANSTPMFATPKTPQVINQTQIPQVKPTTVTAPKIGTNTGLINLNTSTKPATPTTSVNNQGQTGIIAPAVKSTSGSSQVQNMNNQGTQGGINSQTGASTGTTNQNITPPTPQYSATPDVYGQMTTGLANQYTKASPEYLAQQAEANRINQQMEEAKKQMAQQTQQINQSGTWTSRALGEQGQADIANKATLAALGSQYQGATTQLGAANTQQQLQQTALGTAINAAAPTTGVQYGTQIYNPVTGQLQGAGTPFQAGQVSGEQALGQQYAKNVSANNQASAIKNQVVTFLNSNPDINPSDFTDLNSVIGLVNGKVSNPKYAQLSAQLNEYMSTLAPILGVGGDSTDYKTSLAQGMLNAKMQPQGIATLLNTIEQTAKTKLDQQSLGGGTNLGTQSQSVQSASGKAYQTGTKNATGELMWDGTKWTKAK